MKDDRSHWAERVISGLDDACDGIALFELDGTFIYCNRAWKKIHLLDPSVDYAGMKDTVINRSDLSEGIEKAKKSLREGIDVSMERTLEVDGASRTYKITAELVGEGEPRMVMVIFRDVTDLEHVRDALRESEWKYRTISEMTSDYTFVTKLLPGGTLEREWVGGAYEKITGYTEQELNDMIGALLVIHPDDRERVRSLFGLVARGEETELEFRMIAKGGKIRWVHSKARPIDRSPEGYPRGIVTVKDITGRKEAEIVLERRNRELYVVNRIREIFDSAGDRHVMFEKILDAMLETEDALASALAEIDEEKGQFVLTALRNVPKDKVESFRVLPLTDPTVASILENGRVTIVEEESVPADPNRRRTKEGLGVLRTVVFSVSVAESPVAVFLIGYGGDRDIEPEKRRFYEIVRNQIGLQLERIELMEERQHYQDQLRQLTDRLLESLEQERNMMALKLHDEIGQAIVALNGEFLFLENSIKSCNNDQAAIFEKIRHQLKELTQSTRKMSYALHPSMLDDLGLVPTLRWYIDRFVRRDGLEVELITSGFDGRLEDEAALTLYRVAQEALTNIVRHAGATSVIVRLTRGYPDMIMIIEDDGCGFSGRESEVRGLGLVSMRQRIERLGGRLRIASAPGKGTRIRATVPLEVEDG